VRNHVSQLVNEYNPQNVMDYLHLKRKILRRIAQLTQKQNPRMAQILRNETPKEEDEQVQEQEKDIAE